MDSENGTEVGNQKRHSSEFSKTTTENQLTFGTERKCQKCSVPKRYIFTLMSFMSFFTFSYQYSIMSISVVVMVNLTAFSTNKSRSEECPTPAETEQVEHKGGDILWSPEIVGLVLGATPLGSLLTKIPGGRLAERFGGKKLIGIFVTTSSLLTMLNPVVARWGSYPTIIFRFLTGLMLGPIVPDMIFMLGHWIPKTEKNLLTAISCSGISAGSTFSPLIFAWLSELGIFGGWPLIFYFSGFCGLLWVFVWFFLIHETPSQHPTISNKELKYILENTDLKNKNKCLAIPWMKLLTSVPFWALLSGYFCCYWTYGFFITVHSLYLGTILHMPITKNGFHSSLPQLFRLVFTWIGACATHCLLKNKCTTTDVIVKVWMALNAALAMFSFLGITLAGCNETITTILFVFSALLNGLCYTEIRTTTSYMAPALSGTLTGMGEAFGTLTFFIIPAIVGCLIGNEQTMSQWSKVFYMNMAVIGVTSLFFVLFGTTQAQQWAIQTDDDEKGNELEQRQNKINK